MKETLYGISAKVFFAEYATQVTNYAHKMRGIDGNGKPIDFSEDDYKAISAGLAAMMRDKLQAMEKGLRQVLKSKHS